MPPPQSPPDNPKVYEQRVQDSLSRFLERVADPVEAKPADVTPAAFVLQTFVMEVGRFLIDGALWAVWQSKSHLLGAAFDTGVEDAQAHEVAKPSELISIEVGAIQDELSHSGFVITWIRRSDGADCVRIAIEGPRPMALWLVRPPSDVASPAWRWLRSYLPALKSYFIALRALMQTIAAVEASTRRSRYEGRLRQLRSEREKEFSKRLTDIADLLEELAKEDEQEISCIDLAEDLAVILLQELMGTGWAVRQVGNLPADRPSNPGYFIGAGGGIPVVPGDGRPADSQLLKDVCDVLATMVAAALATPEGPERARKTVVCRRLARIIRSLRALVGQDDPSVPGETARGEEALSLLPVWTRVHEACRALCRPRPATREEYEKATNTWGPAVRETLAALPHHLEIHQGLPGPDDPPESRRRGSPSARNWLSLWFALRVLSSMGPVPQLSDRESCALHADVAYVLREGLRFACFVGGDGELLFANLQRLIGADRAFNLAPSRD